ncbi:MAG: archaetidylinositol phosphate synthase [Candidatus Bathyarchaeota archaeon]
MKGEMMFGRLRERYQKTIAPVGTALAKTGISPNAITVLSCLVAILSGYAYSIKTASGGALLIVLTGVFDMLDGAVARATGKITKFGAVLDHVLDRYAEFFMVLGMIFGGYVNWILGFFALFGMLMASFTRAKAESVGGLKSATVGVAERQEKLLMLILGSVLVSVFSVSEALNYAAILVGVLSHITVVQRLHYTWTQTGGQ